MAARLTPAQRDDFGLRAYQMSLRGLRAPEIARQLHISEKAVDRLLKRERRAAWESMGQQEKDESLADFVGEQKAAMAKSWSVTERPDTSPTAVANNVANFITASANIAKARGVLSDKTDVNLTQINLYSQFEELLDRPLPRRIIEQRRDLAG